MMCAFGFIVMFLEFALPSDNFIIKIVTFTLIHDDYYLKYFYNIESYLNRNSV
jgi:hypothetical protein